MILINLLPHREEARKRRREAFFASLGLAALAGGLIAGAVFLWYQTQTTIQRTKNTVLESEIRRLEGQIKEISTLQQEILALRARQQAVEDLQADRNMPVHLLNELVQQLPDGVYIASVRQEGQVVTLAGTAQSQERVSELLRNLGNNSPWLTKPELIEITAGNVALSAREVRKVANFSLKVRLLRSSEVTAAKPGTPASGPAVPPAAGASAPPPAGTTNPAPPAPAGPAATPPAGSMPVKP